LSLVSEIKCRQKTAGFAEAGIRLASDAVEELADRSVLVHLAREKFNDLPAMMIRPTVEAQVSNHVAQLVEQKKIPARSADKVIARVMAKASPLIRNKEREAYRFEQGVRVQAPTTIGETATAASIMTALPWAISRGSYLWGQKPKNPMTLGASLKFNFIPSVLPFSAGFEALGHTLAPLSDPLRQRGERSYLSSMGESLKGAREGLADRSAEARARFGAFGVPLQMFHGIMNPLASLSYLGKEVGGMFKKPDYEEWARQAVAKRQTLQGAE
jgi:hypothetical protein